MVLDNTPILIGVGQVTEKGRPLEEASSPLDLIEQAVYEAAKDANLDKSALAELDTLVIVRGFREPTKNSPEVIKNRNFGVKKGKSGRPIARRPCRDFGEKSRAAITNVICWKKFRCH